MIIAALIPLMAAFAIPEPQSKLVTAILGLLVLVIEAAQQINQYQQLDFLPLNVRGAEAREVSVPDRGRTICWSGQAYDASR